MMKKRLQRIIAQGRFLDEMMAWKRQEVASQMAEMPESDLQAYQSLAPPTQPFLSAIAGPGVSLIAEIKRATPDKGLIARSFDPVDMALAYLAGGASALACVTDARFYQGHLEHLTAIKVALRERRLRAPVLRVDFIYHPYQVLQSRVAGADAILLHMAILGDADYRHLRGYARELSMAVAVAVHDEAELARAVAAEPDLLVLEHRNLHNLQLDPTVSERLRPLAPADVPVAVRSGIRNVDDVSRLKALACDAMIIGESLARQTPGQRQRKARQLVRAGQA